MFTEAKDASTVGIVVVMSQDQGGGLQPLSNLARIVAVSLLKLNASTNQF
jgi:hypothetical protein